MYDSGHFHIYSHILVIFLSILVHEKWHLVVLSCMSCISLMPNDAEPLYMCSLANWIPLEKYLIQILHSLLSLLFTFYWVIRILDIFWFKCINDLRIFFLFCEFSHNFTDGTTGSTKFIFISMYSTLCSFSSVTFAFGVMSKQQRQSHEDLLLYYLLSYI